MSNMSPTQIKAFNGFFDQLFDHRYNARKEKQELTDTLDRQIAEYYELNGKPFNHNDVVLEDEDSVIF